MLFILSTTSGKFSSNQNTYSSKIKKINVEGLSNTENLKISNYSIQGSFPKLLERFAFQKIFQLSIPNRLYFFSEVEWSQKSILKSNLLKVTLQYHNLGINKNTAQVKASHIFRFGEIYLGINSKKNMGIGFLFDTKKILSIGYAFQFPIAVSSDLKLNNHSIYLQFKLKQNPTNTVL